MRWTALVLVGCWGVISAPMLSRAETPRAADEQLLEKAGLKTDAESLLQFFRSRAVRASQDVVRTLIKQLASRSYTVRQRASEKLADLGAKSVPLLQEATKDPELEVRRRAEEILKKIHDNSQPQIITAAARLLAHHKTAGSAEAILDFLPAMIDDGAIRELHRVLAKVGVKDGKPDPVLIKGLEDDSPVRRAAAGAALLHAGVAAMRPKIKPLLKDADANVRRHVALWLVESGDKDAVPVLIGLFEALSPNQLWQVEDVLYRLAGDKAPSIPQGDTAKAKRAFSDAWLAWWKEHGAKVDLAMLHKNEFRNWSLIVLLDESEVLELDDKDQERFRISRLGFPLDAQTLTGDRVLLAEHGGSRVTERLRDGTVLWEKKAAEPLVAQRLANGNTFIGTKNEVFEVDREGKVLFSWGPGGMEQIMRAKRLEDGTTAIILHDTQRYLKLDATGKEMENFSFPVNVQTFGGRVETLADGGVLIPQMYMNKVIEYDGKGKVKRDFTISQPIVATRLPNGNTIITSMNENRAVELDKDGKQVWEYKGKTRVTRVFRR